MPRNLFLLTMGFLIAADATPTRGDWSDDFEPSPGSQQTWQQTALDDGAPSTRFGQFPDGQWSTLPYYDGTLGSADEGLVVYAFFGDVDTIVTYVDETFQDGSVEALVAQSVSENGVPASADVGVYARGNGSEVDGYALTLLFNRGDLGGGDVRLSRYDDGQETELDLGQVPGFNREEDYFLQLAFEGDDLTGKVFSEPDDATALVELQANDAAYNSGVSGVIVDRRRGTFAAGLYDDVVATAAGPAPLPGDFDGDGQVRGGDLIVWQRMPAADAGALDQWQASFGTSPLAANRGSIPEPGVGSLAAALLLAATARRGWRRQTSVPQI